MSIDYFYKIDRLTKEDIERELSEDFNILSIKEDQNGTVSYFSVNPKNENLVINERGYEYHLQDDGRYLYFLVSREDDLFEKEYNVLMLIETLLEMELDI